MALADRFLLMHPKRQRTRGWQAALARAAGVSPPTVSEWVNGKIQTIAWEHAVAVAALYGVNPTWVMTGEGAMRGKETASQDPPPGRRVVSDSDFALLEAVKMLPHKDIEALQEKAAEIRALYERWQRDKMGAGK